MSQIDDLVSAGDNEVPLTNDTFDVGDVVTLNAGHAKAETVRIEAKGSLIFDQQLGYDHGPGELIVLTSSLPEEVSANDPPIAMDDDVIAVPIGITSVRGHGHLAEVSGPVAGAVRRWAVALRLRPRAESVHVDRVAVSA